MPVAFRIGRLVDWSPSELADWSFKEIHVQNYAITEIYAKGCNKNQVCILFGKTEEPVKQRLSK